MTSVYLTICLLILSVSAKQTAAATNQELEQATSEFSRMYLYGPIVQNSNQNTVYSPFSIHAALSMLCKGASGKTWTEMRGVLYSNSNSNNQDIPDQYTAVLNSLKSSPNVNLYIANAVFVNPQAPIKQYFRDQVQSTFQGTVDQLDFNDVNGPERKINDFISQQTRGMIQDMLPRNSVLRATQLVLVNTVYFNGSWAQPFQAAATRQQPFYRQNGGQTNVQMMTDVRNIQHKEDSISATIELPFHGHRFSLYVILPHINNMRNFEENILRNRNTMTNIFQGLQNRRVNIQLPKFRIETTVDLKNTLSQQMPTTFNRNTAEFAWISDSDMWIDQAIHKAVIDLNEQGTEASAATVISVLSSTRAQRGNVDFIANRPFLFFLRDSETGQILFEGKYNG